MSDIIEGAPASWASTLKSVADTIGATYPNAVVRDDEGNSFTRVVFGGTCPWVIGSEYVSLEEGEAAGWPWSRIENPTVISWGVDL